MDKLLYKYQVWVDNQYVETEDKDFVFSKVLNGPEDGNPTLITYYSTTGKNYKVLSVSHYKNGEFHNDNGPAYIEYWPNIDTPRLVEWYQDGKLHNLDSPAYIEYNKNGNIIKEQWYNKGGKHRDDEPAIIEYNDNGSIIKEQWYRFDRLHRVLGPAYIEYNNDGEILKEYWYFQGKFHRINGPALVEFKNGKNLSNYRFYFLGEFLPFGKWYKKIKSITNIRLFNVDSIELAELKAKHKNSKDIYIDKDIIFISPYRPLKNSFVYYVDSKLIDNVNK